MKHLKISAFFISSVITLSSWGAATFTNLAQLDSAIYAGVKNEEKGMELKSHLLEVKVKDLSSRKINLPSDIDTREIVGLIPAKDHLVVITQNTRGGGDKPLIHSFSSTYNNWKKIGEIDCISFADVKVTSSSLEFSCEQTTPEGEVKKVTKKIDTKLSLKAQELTLPVTKLKSSEAEASLVEEDLDWTKLKVTKGKQDKIFTP